jgi:serine/threonine protein kinase
MLLRIHFVDCRWTLGVLLYEMLARCFPISYSVLMSRTNDLALQNGLPPFYDTDTNKMYGRILHDPVHYPEDMSANAREIIAALLQKDPSKRLGLSGAEEIRKCSFFTKIDWNKYGYDCVRSRPSLTSHDIIDFWLRRSNHHGSPVLYVFILSFLPFSPSLKMVDALTEWRQ